MTTGAGALLRTNLRRDRIVLPVWVYLLVAMVAASAFAIKSLYAQQAELIAAARVINASPALVALYGPILHEDSLGEVAMSKMTVMYAMFVMGMALVIVRRHTRTEEETGRAELVASTLIGRSAPLQAALVEASAASIVVGGLSAAVNIAAGLPQLESLAFGASWVGIGLVGTGLAAVCCQLSASTRTSGGIALAAIGVLFAIRAVGDVSLWWLGWLSPLGWGTRIDAWGGPRWWVLGLYLGTAVVLFAVANVLRSRRDLGAGLLPASRGPVTGRISSVLGLAWRLNRLPLLWWTIGAVAFGVMFGSIAPHLDGLFDSPGGKAILESLGGIGAVEKVMLSALLSIMGALLTGFGLQVVSGAAGEETSGRTPVVHAAQGSRLVQYLTVVALAWGGTALLALVYGVGSAIGYGPQTIGLIPAVRELVPAALAHVPAIWVVVSLAVLAWTVTARWAVAGWALWAAFIVVGDVGKSLDWPQWLLNLSPYQHVATVPVESVNWSSECALLGVALAALLLGWLSYRRRALG